ncbi:MAG TPA: 16S rRNA (adenine(1518)-N(6)/adenine(1519)-N(6))-dimethyltransferase RsmA [Pyrinomonadaceae bacterium]
MPNIGRKKQRIAGRIPAKRSLGQNFLVDDSIVDRIVNSFCPTASDIVVEIGPGHGALTEKLVGRVEKLYTLEFDSSLAPLLRRRFSDRDDLVVIEDDALTFDFGLLATPGRRLRVIANLPYNISTAILQRLFDSSEILEDCVLMFQREVAERITAAPGIKDRGYLTIMTELHFDVEHLFDVPPSAFRPAPKIWSSVVRIVPKPAELKNKEAFRKLLSAGFAQKRKTIANNLKALFADVTGLLIQARIDPTRRAETLTLEEWLRLNDVVHK